MAVSPERYNHGFLKFTHLPVPKFTYLHVCGFTCW
jgi:hypothetical protein